MSVQQFASGTVNGSGAAINISTGWKPDHVELLNKTDTAANKVTMRWFRGMAAASGVKNMVTSNVATTSAQKSQDIVTVNGVSMYAGDSTHGSGFTIGADTDLNVANDTICWAAWRNGPGSED